MGAPELFPDRLGCLVRESDDACEHSASATGWSHVYEQLQPGRFHGTHAEAWLGPVQICYERIEGAFKYYGTAWSGSRVFLSFLEGSGELHYDGRPVANQTLITNRWDAVERVTCSRRSELLAVAVNESYLDHYTRQLTGRSFFDDEAVDGTAIVCARNRGLVATFERSVAEALRTIGDHPSLLEDGKALVELRHSILGTLCDALMEQSATTTRLPSSSTRSYIVEKAIEFIEARVADPLTIADVCAAIRVCERTLRYSFEQVLGVTPTRYIRAMRLNGARRDLTAGRRNTVESAAARWGFWHMGRFANYYHQTFGEHPHHTIQKATQARGAPVRAPSPLAEMSLVPPRVYDLVGRCAAS